MKHVMNTRFWLLVLILFSVLVPRLISVPYFLHLMILALIWVVIAQGQNLIQGFTGYVSIASAGFMGVGAYASTLLSLRLGMSVWTAMVCAPFITACIAVFVGYPSLRVKGHYFAIVTLAYNLVIFIILNNFSSLTGGEGGLTNVPRPEGFNFADIHISFESRESYYYLVLFAAIFSTAICALIMRSRVGQVLLSIRQNETLAMAVGIETWHYKLFAFVLSAAFAGLAGALYAHFIGFLNPEPFGVDQSLNAILAVILGGSGTLSGPIVGAFLVVALPEYLRVADTLRLIVYGGLLIVTTIYMPKGVVPMVVAGFSRIRSLLKRKE
jgi:branched-chain amino acid transport system permease protein